MLRRSGRLAGHHGRSRPSDRRAWRQSRGPQAEVTATAPVRAEGLRYLGYLVPFLSLAGCLVRIRKAVEITFRGRGIRLLAHCPVVAGGSLQDIAVLSRGCADHVIGHSLARDSLGGSTDGDRRAPIDYTASEEEQDAGR
jgi:hypothetical protein